MISLNQEKNIFLWAGVLLLLLSGILTLLQSSSVYTALIAIIALVLILIWKFA
ncbi:MAG: hypothetical protein ACXVH2_06650 [Methanobacterium sp.]